MTDPEQIKLAREYNRKSTSAKRRDVIFNLFLEQYKLLFISYQSRIKPDLRADLKQELSICLLKAIKKFNPERNTKFITYLFICMSDGLSKIYGETLIPIERSARKKLEPFTYVQIDEIVQIASPIVSFEKYLLGLTILQKQILRDKFIYNFTLDELSAKYTIDRNKLYKLIKDVLAKQRKLQPWKMIE